MELILIACSNRKSEGGSQVYQQPHIKEYLTKETYHQLLSLRKAIAQMKSIPSGPDLANNASNEVINYKPAYIRYSGIIYKRSNIAGLYKKSKNKKILIFSGLYGLLDAEDMIRDYEVRIDETLPIRAKIYTWWKNHGLLRILEECIFNLNPSRIHDLLSQNYRLTLSTWPSNAIKLRNIEYIPYDYPGQGQGASWHRGDDLRNLLMM
jgi:cytoplasmic iron level regulating protein YaaA (DUF328/UPF0246 family)